MLILDIPDDCLLQIFGLAQSISIRATCKGFRKLYDQTRSKVRIFSGCKSIPVASLHAVQELDCGILTDSMLIALSNCKLLHTLTIFGSSSTVDTETVLKLNSGCPSLRHLIVAPLFKFGSKITPPSFSYSLLAFFPNLESCEISKFTSLASRPKDLGVLQVISKYCNKLKRCEILRDFPTTSESFEAFFSACPELTHICLACTFLDYDAVSEDTIVSAKQCAGLTVLRLQTKALDLKITRIWDDLLAACPNLVECVVPTCLPPFRFSAEYSRLRRVASIASFHPAPEDFPNLTHISELNWLDQRSDFNPFARFSQLQSLSFAWISRFIGIPWVGFEHLTQLRSVRIGSWDMDEVHLLRVCPSIEEITISRIIPSVTGTFPNVKKLTLDLQNEDEALCVRQRFPCLRELVLNNTPILDNVIRTQAKDVGPTLPHLEVLRTYGCPRISAAVLRNIARQCPNLVSLSIEGTDFPLAIDRDLLETVRGLRSLRRLHISASLTNEFFVNLVALQHPRLDVVVTSGAKRTLVSSKVKPRFLIVNL